MRRRRIIDWLVLALALLGFMLLDETHAGRFLAFAALVGLAKEWARDVNDESERR